MPWCGRVVSRGTFPRVVPTLPPTFIRPAGNGGVQRPFTRSEEGRRSAVLKTYPPQKSRRVGARAFSRTENLASPLAVNGVERKTSSIVYKGGAHGGDSERDLPKREGKRVGLDINVPKIARQTGAHHVPCPLKQGGGKGGEV